MLYTQSLLYITPSPFHDQAVCTETSQRKLLEITNRQNINDLQKQRAADGIDYFC